MGKKERKRRRRRERKRQQRDREREEEEEERLRQQRQQRQQQYLPTRRCHDEGTNRSNKNNEQTAADAAAASAPTTTTATTKVAASTDRSRCCDGDIPSAAAAASISTTRPTATTDDDDRRGNNDDGVPLPPPPLPPRPLPANRKRPLAAVEFVYPEPKKNDDDNRESGGGSRTTVRAKEFSFRTGLDLRRRQSTAEDEDEDALYPPDGIGNYDDGKEEEERRRLPTGAAGVAGKTTSAAGGGGAAGAGSRSSQQETIHDILFGPRKKKSKQQQQRTAAAEKDDDECRGQQQKQQQQPEKTNGGDDSRAAALAHKVSSVSNGCSSAALEQHDEYRTCSGGRDGFNSRGGGGGGGDDTDPNNNCSSSSASASASSDSNSGGHLSGVSVEDVVRDRAGCRPRANSTDGELNLPQRGLCDERKVLLAHKWAVDPCHGPTGLVNTGNTCYLNSTLQCLAYLPPFCQSLISLPDVKQDSLSSSFPQNENGYRQHKLSQGKRITMILRALFRRIHCKAPNGYTTGHGRPISPHDFVNSVPLLGSCGSRNGYKFRPGRQEDAHEFLVHLLDAMNDGELQQAGIDQHSSGWRDRLPIPRLDETTFVHRVFGGYFRSQVKCTSCGNRSNTYDPFLDLSLEVSRKSCHSIDDAIREFTRKETLDSDNRWKCSGCKKHVCATKQLTVFRPPLSLCVQLKRFKFGAGAFASSFSGGALGYGHFSGFGGGRFGKKISKPVSFPALLKLPLSDGRACEYGLTGVVIHVGGSASSGHYTAYVKKPSRNGSDRWFHVDDSFVEAVSERNVLQQKDAYLLFYCRKEVKLEFPAPPLSSSMTAEEATERGRSRARARSNSLLEHQSGCNDSGDTKAGERKMYPSSETQSIVGTEVKSVSNGTGSDNEDTPVAGGRTDSSSNNSRAGEFGDGSSAQPPSSNDDALTGGSGSSCNGSIRRSANSSSELQSGNYAALAGTDKRSAASALLANDLKGPTRNKTRVVLNRGPGQGKVEVVVGPRSSAKAWKPNVDVSHKGDGYGLLGNHRVGQWTDDESELDQAGGRNNKDPAREQLLSHVSKNEQKRKRKMFANPWDAKLDQGRVSADGVYLFSRFTTPPSSTSLTSFVHPASKKKLKVTGDLFRQRIQRGTSSSVFKQASNG